MAENEDTEKGLSDFVPFKNLFNEWFAKDTSRKVKTALHAKFAAGERTFAYAPLGYIRHPEVKNTLAIDEETRWIIEKIFDLAFHGAGAAKITKTLICRESPDCRLAELSEIWNFRQYLCPCAGRKIVCLDDCSGQKYPAR